MDIKDMKFKITPKAIAIVEEKYPDFNIVEVYINCQSNDKNPKISDALKIIYTGYIGAGNKEMSYEDFEKEFEDVHFVTINNIAVGLLTNLKN